MILFLTAAFIFSVIVTTEQSYLSCFLCDKLQQNDCRGTLGNCSEGEICMAVSLVIKRKYQGNVLNYFIRRCSKPENCNFRERTTTLLLEISYSTTCCNTSACIPPKPEVILKSNVPNEMTCPTCAGIITNGCEMKNSMQCMGEENHCVLIKDSEVNFTSGCSTKNVCKILNEFKMDHWDLRYDGCSVYSQKSTLPMESKALWCVSCENEKTMGCTPLKCRPEYDTCITETIMTVSDERKTLVVSKRCGYSSECKRTGTIHSSGIKIFFNTSCCDEDGCFSPQPKISSPLNNVTNGLTCSSCFVENSAQCFNKDNIQCLGDASHCIHYSKTTSLDDLTFKDTLFGCSSKGICEAGSYNVPRGANFYKNLKVDIMCSNASRIYIQVHTLLISSFALYKVLQL